MIYNQKIKNYNKEIFINWGSISLKTVLKHWQCCESTLVLKGEIHIAKFGSQITKEDNGVAKKSTKNTVNMGAQMVKK